MGVFSSAAEASLVMGGPSACCLGVGPAGGAFDTVCSGSERGAFAGSSLLGFSAGSAGADLEALLVTGFGVPTSGNVT